MNVQVANVAVTGLVAAYGFNETTGTVAADATGNNRTGTVNGAAWNAAGRFGGALSFDGVEDLVTVADANALDLTTGMTLSAWVRPVTLSGWRTALLKEATNGLAYALMPTTTCRSRQRTRISAGSTAAQQALRRSRSIRGAISPPHTTGRRCACS